MSLITRSFSTMARRSIVSITDRAWNKMKEVMDNNPEYTKFVLTADGRGCSGFSYSLKSFDDAGYEEFMTGWVDQSVVEDDSTGVNVTIDPSVEMYIMGTEVDYVHEDISKGIMGSKFTFTPDNEIATSCGCGISFSPKTV